MYTAVLWQKEATLENNISCKWAKCVCHLHWHQCNIIMISWLKYLSAGWVFLFQTPKSNLKTAIYQIWMICQLLPFVRGSIVIIIVLIRYELCCTNYSRNKKSEYVHSLRSEFLEKKRVKLEWIWSEFGMNICVIHSFWSDLRDHSESLSDPCGHSKISE